MHDVLLVAAAFLACTVEMVEALTIVLAVGVTRGWRSAIIGTAGALGALTVVVAALGPALAVIPIDSLRLFVGGILLVFGLQWLRKAILRSSGFKALHDEDAIFAEEQRAARAAAVDTSGIDWYTFTVSFKGVFLEGLEVAFIVVTFGGAQHNVGLAAIGAAAAAVVVLIVGLAVHRPLSRVPENTMKYAVGVMLTTFGVFWAGEGAGIRWPGSDAALIGMLAYVLGVSMLLSSALRRRHERLAPAGAVA
ncbi:MAG: COG4280 domain-containing protein [Acidimicrobiales bacterium]